MRRGSRSRVIGPIICEISVALKSMKLSDRLLAATIVRTIFNCMPKTVTSMAYHASAIRWLWGVGASVGGCIVRWWSAVGSGIGVRWAMCISV